MSYPSKVKLALARAIALESQVQEKPLSAAATQGLAEKLYDQISSLVRKHDPLKYNEASHD